MEKQVISQDLIDQLKKHNANSQEFVVKFGQIEVQIQELNNFKQLLLKEYETHKQNEKQLTETLQQKYGDGNINLETGEFTPVLPVS